MEQRTRRELFGFGHQKERVDRNLTTAIFEELGIGSNQVQLFMRFGNHVLDTDRMGEISRLQPDIVMGEFTKHQIVDAFDQSTSVANNDDQLEIVKARLRRPGVGVSYREREKHRRHITTLLKCGTAIGALDVERHSSIYDSDPPSSIASGALVLSTLAMIGALPAVKAQELVAQRRGKMPLFSAHPTRRTVLKAGASLSTYAGLILLQRGLQAAGLDLDEGKIVPRKIRSTDGRDVMPITFHETLDTFYEELRLALGIDKVAFETHTKILIDFRNKIMALNLWAAINRYAGSPYLTKLFFTAGNGHRNIYHEFLSGIDNLEAGVREYASRLCTDSLDFIIREADLMGESDSNIGADEVVVAQMAHLATMFSGPEFFGKNIPEFTDGTKRTCQTPQAILIDALRAEVDILRSKNDAYIRKVEIIERVLALLNTHIYYEDLTLRENDEALFRDRAKSDTAISESNILHINKTYYNPYRTAIEAALLRTDNESDKTVLVHPNSVSGDKHCVGMVNFRGRYYPVERVYTQDGADRIVTRDLITLRSGVEILIDTNRYNRLADTELTDKDRIIHTITTYREKYPTHRHMVRGPRAGIKPTHDINGNPLDHSAIDFSGDGVASIYRRESNNVDASHSDLVIIENVVNR